ncbi:hypothetical protein CIT28_27940 (plasmid) [Klebsiella pneumoniae]|nr:hypothetical protein CIT20_27985 [Klebsiella pneumoniae]OZN55956.1 hypothetical protein CIT28_27940 [Klebsiella pneumoniae]
MKMPAFEWVHVQLHQQKGMISLSPPTICNSALGFTKLFKKSKKVDETNIQLANSWIGVNNHLIEKVLPNLKWDMGIGSSTALFGESGG